MKSIKFAFVQSGYCVFGVGFTERQAISDARKWLEPKEGAQGSMSFRDVEALLSNQTVDGGFEMLHCDDDEFDSYLKNQGGFVKRGNGWYPQK